MSNRLKNLFTLCIILLATACSAQDKTIVPDLAKIATGDGWFVFNREAKIVKDNDKVQVHFNGLPGAGGAWLETVDFADGIIECDIKTFLVLIIDENSNISPFLSDVKNIIRKLSFLY